MPDVEQVETAVGEYDAARRAAARRRTACDGLGRGTSNPVASHPSIASRGDSPTGGSTGVGKRSLPAESAASEPGRCRRLHRVGGDPAHFGQPGSRRAEPDSPAPAGTGA